MSWLSGALSLAGSLFGSSKSASSADKASELQAQIARETADKQLQLQREQYNQAMDFYKTQQGKLSEYYEPYRQAGLQSLSRLQQEALSPNSELYEMQKQDLERSMNSQLASRGLYGSGRGIQMLAEQQRRLGGQETVRRQGLLQDLYSGGLQSTSGLGNASMGLGNQMAELSSGYGNTLSNIYGGLGNSLSASAGQQGQNQANYWGDISGMLGTLGINQMTQANQQKKPQIDLSQYGMTQQNPFGMLSNVYGRVF